MTIQTIYTSYLKDYAQLEQDYAAFLTCPVEWETLHLQYLLHYMVTYQIEDIHYVNSYHYRTCYRLYLEEYFDKLS